MKITGNQLGILGAVVLAFHILSCGGGGAEPGGTVEQNAIIIETPEAGGSYTSECNDIVVGGEADFDPSRWDSVRIYWENQTHSGLYQGTGLASVDQCMGWFFGYTWYYDCNAGWWADVPLEMGSNIIKITAYEVVNNQETKIGEDSITVTKPEMSYAVTGRITNIDGTPLFNMKVVVEETGGYGYTDTNGDFEISCLGNGSYTVAPDTRVYYFPGYRFFNYMDWPFTPAQRTVTVADADVSNQDFTTEVYEVSGRITTLSGYGFPNVDVSITGSDGKSQTTTTENDGNYMFLVPNGTFTILPSPYFSFTPVSRSIDVSENKITGQDFVQE